MPKILIISDLHCKVDQDGDRDSLLWVRKPAHPIKANPMSSLVNLIGMNPGKFENTEILLCPGDITDKANPDAFVFGWGKLKDIKTKVGAHKLIATIGNHDVDSRNVDPERAYEFIKAFPDIDFPVDDAASISKFWADKFYITETSNFIVLVYNSSHDHTTPVKSAQSNIDETTREKILTEMHEYIGNPKIRVAMCHHHPIAHQNRSIKDTDIIDGGSELITLLRSLNFKIVVHGHKHIPRFTEQNGLAVLGCGTFSSMTNIGSNGYLPMFHLVEINSRLAGGTIDSWVYSTENGWLQKSGQQFPMKTGFGFVGDLESLASEINIWFGNLSTPLCDFQKVVDQFPSINYLNTFQQKDFSDLLLLSELEFVPAFPDTPLKLAKRIQ